MTDQGPLFAGFEPAEPTEPLSADRSRTVRQRAAITTGMHPLSLVVDGLRLHPDATRDHRDAAHDGPRCGSCVWRRVGGFPKCTLGGGLRISHGAASDVRAWWPGCTDWQARP